MLMITIAQNGTELRMKIKKMWEISTLIFRVD